MKWSAGTGDGAEYKKLLGDFVEAVEQRAEKLPRMVWKEMVPTHYDQQHGLYPGGEPPFTCAPLHVKLQGDGNIEATDDWSKIVVEGGHHNKAAREAFAGTDIVMTGYWNATVELFDYHRDVSDGRGHECGCAAPCPLVTCSSSRLAKIGGGVPVPCTSSRAAHSFLLPAQLRTSGSRGSCIVGDLICGFLCCRHYCFPGAPQVWLYHAYLAILKAPWSPLPAN